MANDKKAIGKIKTKEEMIKDYIDKTKFVITFNVVKACYEVVPEDYCRLEMIYLYTVSHPNEDIITVINSVNKLCDNTIKNNIYDYTKELYEQKMKESEEDREYDKLYKFYIDSVNSLLKRKDMFKVVKAEGDTVTIRYDEKQKKEVFLYRVYKNGELIFGGGIKYIPLNLFIWHMKDKLRLTGMENERLETGEIAYTLIFEEKE